MQNYETIIIGTGPAGLSAAIYTSRANIKTIIIGKQQESQLWKVQAIENYFGIESKQGKNLLVKGIEQAMKFGAHIKEAEAVNIKQKENKFTVKISTGEKFTGKTLILATGMPIKSSGIKNEEKLTGKGVHYCVVCDGFFYKDKKVAVIGDSNYAAEQAIELLIYTKDVSIISNGKEFKLDQKYKKILEQNKIELIPNKIISFEGTKKLEKIKTKQGYLKFDGVFMALGSAGAIDFAKRFGIQTKANTIIVDRNGRTNIPGIYAAGTCTGGISQVTACTGQGCEAAISVIKQLKGKKAYTDYGSKKNQKL